MNNIHWNIRDWGEEVENLCIFGKNRNNLCFLPFSMLRSFCSSIYRILCSSLFSSPHKIRRHNSSTTYIGSAIMASRVQWDFGNSHFIAYRQKRYTKNKKKTKIQIVEVYVKRQPNERRIKNIYIRPNGKDAETE